MQQDRGGDGAQNERLGVVTTAKRAVAGDSAVHVKGFVVGEEVTLNITAEVTK